MRFNPIEFPSNDDQFAEDLVNRTGLKDARARVVSRRLHGMSRSETAEDLNISPNTVDDHIRHFSRLKEESENLTGLVSQPDYLSELPDVSIGGFFERHMEHTIGFTLHRPIPTADGLDIQAPGAGVVEGYALDPAGWLLVYFEIDNYGATETFALITEENLLRFIHDWLVTGRYWSPEGNPWYVTDLFEPSGLEQALRNHSIAPTDVLLDERFVSPVGSRSVLVEEGAHTGGYPDGFKIGYNPSEREVATLFDCDELDAEQAAEMLHTSEEQFFETVERLRSNGELADG